MLGLEPMTRGPRQQRPKPLGHQAPPPTTCDHDHEHSKIPYNIYFWQAFSLAVAYLDPFGGN